MKKLAFIYLLVFSFFTYADKPEENYQAQIEAEQWETNLNHYLINHRNPNISMVGIHHALIMYDENKIETDFSGIKQAFHDLVANFDLSTQSLFLAESICRDSYYLKACKFETLHTKLMQSEPYNLVVYLPFLDLAFSQKNKSEITKTMALMSNSTFSNFYNTNSILLDDAIDGFNDENLMLSSLSFSKLGITKGLFTEEKLKDMEENADLYHRFMQKVNFKLSNPIPSFRPLIDTCKDTIEHGENCLKIADVMIKNGHSLVVNIVGYHIKWLVLQELGSMSQALRAEENKINFKREYKCIMDAFNAGSSMDNNFSLEFYSIGTKLEREVDEYTAFKKMAEMNYQHLLKKGDESAIDPQTCIAKDLL